MVLILSDTDVARSCTASRSIAVMRRALHAHGEGRLSAPPRTYNDIAPGRLVYTAGALEGLVHGVRIYDHADSEQVVAVWDSPSRRLAAVILGAELGRRRTGAIGAVAIDALARPDATTLGIIGTGHQAWTQVWAATTIGTGFCPDSSAIYWQDGPPRAAGSSRSWTQGGPVADRVPTTR